MTSYRIYLINLEFFQQVFMYLEQVILSSQCIMGYIVRPIVVSVQT